MTVSEADIQTFRRVNVQSGAQGDYRDLGNEAGASKNLSEGFAEMYAQKMNKSIDEVKELMDATTWYNAKHTPLILQNSWDTLTACRIS